MNIGIIGAGKVGKTLAKGLSGAGHSVLISTRDTEIESLIAWNGEMGNPCTTGIFTDAAHFGEMIILAINWSGVEPLLEELRPALQHKIVIDLSNAVKFGHPPRLLLEHGSAGERVQQWLPESQVVKTLNVVGASNMVNPSFDSGTPTMLMAGNNADAKAIVMPVLHDLGWKDVIDLGDISQSRLLESLMMTLLICEMQLQNFEAVFALLRK